MSSKLVSLANHTIKNPTDYYKGSAFTYPVKPTNTVCFLRKTSTSLNPANEKKGGYHHRCVMIHALKGHGYVCVDTKKFYVKENQTLFIFPFQFHHYLNVQPKDICWLFITFEMHNLETLSSLRMSGPRNMGEKGHVLLEMFLEEWKNSHKSQMLGYYLSLMLQYYSEEKAMRHHPSVKGRLSSSEDLLLKINQYLVPRLNKPISLSEIASSIGMSESHMRATFHKITGTSLGNHVRLLRMQKAAGLLLQTSATVNEISDKCGFDSVYSFSRAFKNVYGMSPRAYRLKVGN